MPPFVSPNAGAAAGFGRFRIRASGYRSFRGPTLNELYRNFRVGNTLTFANAGLVPEGLTGVETGWIGQAKARAFHELNNLIDNATLTASPVLITRRRENFPSALSRGFEASLMQRWRKWRFEAGCLFADARLASGQRIPEVPKQQGTAAIAYAGKATLLSFGARAFGLQFDDDLIRFKLPGYAALAASAEQHLTKKLSALASVENLLDRSFLVALTPTPNTGEPRLWRVGLRWSGSVH